MLQRAGRWLRAAGYDVVIAEPGQPDRLLLEQAKEEGRWLLTRDREFTAYRQASDYVMLVEANQLEEILAEISARLHINWLRKPFSRCMECNTPLEPAPESVKRRVPPESLREDETLLYCPRCDKAYWNGSHVKRMRRQLERFSHGCWQINGEES